MTDREASFYKFMETFTLAPAEQRGHPHYELALARGYVKRDKGGDLTVTEAGWGWFTARCGTIIAHCAVGLHEYRPKTPFCSGLHCRWCGTPEDDDCPQCEEFMAARQDGELLTPTTDQCPRSTIWHDYKTA